MAEHSKISWTDATWNPIAGCSLASPGCRSCYAMGEAHRLGRNPKLKGKYEGLTKLVNGRPVWTGEVRFWEAALDQPLRWRKPKRIFVNSMSDLFHEDVPDEWIDRVFAVMALAPQHQFQVLTKRSARLRAYCSAPGVAQRIWDKADEIACKLNLGEAHPSAPYLMGGKAAAPWPLSNVWLGVSVEDQERADERIPDLLATPAAVRFLSVEPMLGPIKLWEYDEDEGALRGPGVVVSGGMTASTPYDPPEGYDDSYPGIDQVICGGESGPRARRFEIEWARSLKAQCVNAGVAFHMKQLGSNPTGYPIKHPKGEDPSEWPEDLRVREMPGEAA